MAGERNSWRNTDGEWHPRVCELAESFGYDRKGLWFWYRQISLCIFREARWPQACAEAWAWECLRAVFDKRGQKGS